MGPAPTSSPASGLLTAQHESLVRLPRSTPSVIVLAPSLVGVAVFVYGFIGYTIALSFTSSTMLPHWDWVGVSQYLRLFGNYRWGIAVHNMLVFGGLYIVGATTIGLTLAILLDQRIRVEGALRSVFLYPMALSFIVTGVVWQWVMNPGLGLEHLVHELGWPGFSFEWIVEPEFAIYCVVIAGVWQISGYVMAIFLAGLRAVNPEIIRAAKIDGASPYQTYWHVVIPTLRPTFLSALVVQAHMAIKSYDLVVALTKGGPGNATELPTTFMYSSAFLRDELALGASSAVVLLTTIAAIVIPYLYSELRNDDLDKGVRLRKRSNSRGATDNA